MPKSIWCLFSVTTDQYDQPPNSLVGWWEEKPNFETILASIGGSLSDTSSILAAANIIQAYGDTIYYHEEYRLEEVIEGRLP